MPPRIEIASSDPALLRNATRTAEAFARQCMRSARGGPAVPQVQHVEEFKDTV